MPRVVEITLPPGRTEAVSSCVAELDQVISIQVQKGISRHPPGDVITVVITDRSLPRLIQLLVEQGLDRHPGASITTSRPESVLSAPWSRHITGDDSMASWEELESLLHRESGMTANTVGVMSLAGFIAALGLLTDALHLLVGAMVIAPGFEPLSRIALGWVGRSRAWRRGGADALKGYAALMAGAALAAAVARPLGLMDPGDGAYLQPGALLAHWPSFSPSTLLVSAAASLAGAILVITMRSVLTAGVMIALALVPAAALVGIGLASAEPGVAAQALLRLALEVALVLGASALVFAWKRYRVERRRMSM